MAKSKEQKSKYDQEYQKTHMERIGVWFNLETDKDLIDWFESRDESVSSYTGKLLAQLPFFFEYFGFAVNPAEPVGQQGSDQKIHPAEMRIALGVDDAEHKIDQCDHQQRPADTLQMADPGVDVGEEIERTELCGFAEVNPLNDSSDIFRAGFCHETDVFLIRGMHFEADDIGIRIAAFEFIPAVSHIA